MIRHSSQEWEVRGWRPAFFLAEFYEYGAGVARWKCIWLAVLLDAESWVWSSSGENFSGWGNFSFGVNMGSDSIPSKTLLDERINRGLVCAHMHCIPSHGLKRSLGSCSRRVNAGSKNTPSMHHSRRRNVTSSMIGLQNGHICKYLTQNGEPQRSSWGTQKKKKKCQQW